MSSSLHSSPDGSIASTTIAWHSTAGWWGASTSVPSCLPASTRSASAATPRGDYQLVIVESPAKAKTIGKYLGPEFVVEASVGHIRDLPTKTLGIDLEEGFEPEYVTIPGKEKTVAELKQAARGAHLRRKNIGFVGLILGLTHGA